MVLWSLSNTARSLPAFNACRYFGVHILSFGQRALAALFATRGADKFADLQIERGLEAIPLLAGCTARYQCRTAFRYEAGDHVIFVGEVIEFDHLDLAPLVFHRGRYTSVGPEAD
jgi:3-hydroxy-9,10-secoandrosta-1,3,5(10)-triene-9,17-dione monooxygenase reductase component